MTLFGNNFSRRVSTTVGSAVESRTSDSSLWHFDLRKIQYDEIDLLLTRTKLYFIILNHSHSSMRFRGLTSFQSSKVFPSNFEFDLSSIFNISKSHHIIYSLQQCCSYEFSNWYQWRSSTKCRIQCLNSI